MNNAGDIILYNAKGRVALYPILQQNLMHGFHRTVPISYYIITGVCFGIIVIQLRYIAFMSLLFELTAKQYTM